MAVCCSLFGGCQSCHRLALPWAFRDSVSLYIGWQQYGVTQYMDLCIDLYVPGQIILSFVITRTIANFQGYLSLLKYSPSLRDLKKLFMSHPSSIKAGKSSSAVFCFHKSSSFISSSSTGRGRFLFRTMQGVSGSTSRA